MLSDAEIADWEAWRRPLKAKAVIDQGTKWTIERTEIGDVKLRDSSGQLHPLCRGTRLKPLLFCCWVEDHKLELIF